MLTCLQLQLEKKKTPPFSLCSFGLGVFWERYATRLVFRIVLPHHQTRSFCLLNLTLDCADTYTNCPDTWAARRPQWLPSMVATERILLIAPVPRVCTMCEHRVYGAYGHKDGAYMYGTGEMTPPTRACRHGPAVLLVHCSGSRKSCQARIKLVKCPQQP